ncbi:MAG: lytic transglycosylase domain-containing protein [Rikenellaceae bacterium]
MNKRGVVVLAALSMVILFAGWSYRVSAIGQKGSSSEECSLEIVKIHPLPKKIEFASQRVPIELNYVREAIEREVLTTASMHTSTMLTLRRTARYFPIIEPILKEHGVPSDFKYLALAESGLNENAFSPAKAAGVWQFIKSTAGEYDLECNSDVDMRYNIEAATHAACQYLLKSYEEFGDWALVAASYNLGSAGVRRRLETQGVTDYWNLFLPEETMRYVPRIVAFKIFMESPRRYGFVLDEEDYFKPYTNYKEVEISEKNIDWSAFAASHSTSYRVLRILNPWIRTYTYANPKGKSYMVKIPTAEFQP